MKAAYNAAHPEARILAEIRLSNPDEVIARIDYSTPVDDQKPPDAISPIIVTPTPVAPTAP